MNSEHSITWIFRSSKYHQLIDNIIIVCIIYFVCILGCGGVKEVNFKDEMFILPNEQEDKIYVKDTSKHRYCSWYYHSNYNFTFSVSKYGSTTCTHNMSLLINSGRFNDENIEVFDLCEQKHVILLDARNVLFTFQAEKGVPQFAAMVYITQKGEKSSHVISTQISPSTKVDSPSLLPTNASSSSRSRDWVATSLNSVVASETPVLSSCKFVLSLFWGYKGNLELKNCEFFHFAPYRKITKHCQTSPS